MERALRHLNRGISRFTFFTSLRRSILWSVIILLLTVGAYSSSVNAGGEQFTGEHPAPDSVEKIPPPLEQQFHAQPEQGPAVVDGIFGEEARTTMPFFLKDQSLSLKLRNYYFLQDNRDNSISEAFALGGWMAYDTGWLFDRVALGTVVYGSQKLYAPDARDGTGLLLPGQQSFAVIGQAYSRIRLTENHVVSVFRQQYELPYVNTFDLRILPITFEAYSIEGKFLGNEQDPKLQYIAGYVAQIKLRDANRFVSMAEAAGVNGVNRGLVMSGLRLIPTQTFNLGTINYLVPDLFNTTYAEANYLRSFSENGKLSTKLQLTYQTSVGDQLLTGVPFVTHQVAGEVAASYHDAIFRIGFSTTGSGSPIRSPYGIEPSPLRLILSNFGRAGEDAWLMGFSYDFKRQGLEGLSGFLNFAQGFGAKGLPNEQEVNVTIDYRVSKGALNGFWFRIRHAWLDEMDGNRTIKDFRVELNYDLSLL
jgi:outer membrane porin, OprD family